MSSASSVFDRRYSPVAGLVLGLLFCFAGSLSPALANGLKIQASERLSVRVDTDQVVRNEVPNSFFGFNINWRTFQYGYWQNNRVRQEVIDYMRFFPGAIYRYPGGTVANKFVFDAALGPAAERAPQRLANNTEIVAQFGPAEFMDFVRRVGGVPLFVLNLSGQHRDDWSDADIALQAEEVVRLLGPGEAPTGDAADARRPCQLESACHVHWWQLGNELDHGKRGWTANRYAAAAKRAAAVVRRGDPTAGTIVNLKTAPWGRPQRHRERPRDFNYAVASEVAGVADAYAFHAYYDGVPVPKMIRFMQSALDDIRRATGIRQPRLFVTEHARWPNRPRSGKWQQTWHRTGDLSGAISTADFLLASLYVPEIELAVWHALGARGPWQLLRSSKKSGQIFPNAVYWGLRVLYEGKLDQLLAVETASPNRSRYRGGYDVRAAVTRKNDGSAYSLLTVNRDGEDQRVEFVVPELANRQFAVEQTFIAGESPSVENTTANPSAIALRQRSSKVSFDAQGRAELSLPGYSVVATRLDVVREP